VSPCTKGEDGAKDGDGFVLNTALIYTCHLEQ